MIFHKRSRNRSFDARGLVRNTILAWPPYRSIASPELPSWGTCNYYTSGAGTHIAKIGKGGAVAVTIRYRLHFVGILPLGKPLQSRSYRFIFMALTGNLETVLKSRDYSNSWHSGWLDHILSACSARYEVRPGVRRLCWYHCSGKHIEHSMSCSRVATPLYPGPMDVTLFQRLHATETQQLAISRPYVNALLCLIAVSLHPW